MSRQQQIVELITLRINQNIMQGIFKYLIIFLLSLVLCSCLDNRKFYKEIKSYYNSNCKNLRNKNCYVNIKDIIKIDWDSVYFIKGAPSNNHIMSLKNIDSQLLLDPVFDKIIFVKNNNVLYQEEIYPQGNNFFDFSKKSENTLIFDFENELCLSSKLANIIVESKDGKLFRLKLFKK